MAKSKPHYFFKVFFPDSSTDQLKLPPAFGEHIEVESSSRVLLKGPSKNIWKVHLVKKKNGLFFEGGWKEFIGDHGLVVGDFLFFRYDGGLRFRVFVFDSTACEKKNAFVAKPRVVVEVQDVEESEEVKVGEEEVVEEVKEVKEEEDDENKPLALFKKRVEGKFKRKRGTNSLSAGSGSSKKSADKKADLSPASGGLVTPKEECISYSSSSSGNSSGGPKAKRNGKSIYKNSATSPALNKIMKTEYHNDEVAIIKSTPKNSNKGIDWVKCNEVDRPRGPRGILRTKALTSQRRPVTEKEVEKALERASSFESKNPFVITVMQESYVYTSFFMCVPTWFAKKYLPEENTELTLWDPYGKSWPVNYISYSRHGALSGGWGKFSYANNLEKFDVCLFELIKPNNLKVHIYRVVDEIKPLIRRRDKR